MAIEVYDVDGNPVEGVLGAEEAAEVQKSLEETKEKLTKLENKDFNFRRLEQMTEAEKEKLTVTELALKEQQEKLEADQVAFQAGFVGDIKKDILDSRIGDDEELRKKVEHHYARFPEAKDAKTRSEIESLIDDAMTLSTGSRVRNPLTAAMGHSGDAPTPSKPGVITDELAAMGSKMGISKEDIEKYS